MQKVPVEFKTRGDDSAGRASRASDRRLRDESRQAGDRVGARAPSRGAPRPASSAARAVASLDPKITTRPWTEVSCRARPRSGTSGRPSPSGSYRRVHGEPRALRKTTPFRGSSRPSAPRGRSPVFAPPPYRAEPTTRSRTTGAVPARGHSSFFWERLSPRSGRGAGAGASVDSDRNDGFRVLRGRGVAGPLRGTSTARRRRIAGRRISGRHAAKRREGPRARLPAARPRRLSRAPPPLTRLAAAPARAGHLRRPRG